MNLKTTLALLILTVAGGISWLLLGVARPITPPSETQSVLENVLRPDQVTHIEVDHGGQHLVLDRAAGGDWTMPGNWPTRGPEVKQLVDLVTDLRSRFKPTPLTGDPPDLKPFGLDPSQGPVAVTVHAGDKDYHLLFGEKSGETNRFARATFLRLGDQNEVVQLGPGLVAVLTRPADYYQQRRLLPSERVQEGESTDKTERLAARAIAVKSGGNTFTLAKVGDDWLLTEPVRDHVDPDKLKSILTAAPDIWAEQFVDKPKSDLAEYGLKEPEQTLSVTRPGAKAPLTLLIGKTSSKKSRIVMRPGPPGQFGQPGQPVPETVEDEYRWAKLHDNNQIFEIKADKLKDIFVALNTLRDPQVARFRGEDARHVEIHAHGQKIVLGKDKGIWKLKEPLTVEAETSKVNELLDKLAGLQARDKDVIDKADPKAYGLDKPAGTVTVQVEETKGKGEAKTTKSKTFTFTLGKGDDDKKLYVRVADLDRVNAVEDNVLPLVKRPALAYRGRQLIDVAPSGLARIDMERGGEKFTLQQDKDTWSLAAPVKASVDPDSMNKLAGDLARLEAVEYVSDAAKAEDLDKLYGLANPAVKATVTFTKADKPAETLLLGKQRGDKPDYFAKLASGPAVFVVKKDLHDELDKSSLAFRPAHLWQIDQADITDLRFQKEGQEFHLKREGPYWKIVEPFEARALSTRVKEMEDSLVKPAPARYEAHVAKELGAYGLDKPYLRVVLTTAPKKEGETIKEPAKDHVLLIGKPTGVGAEARFAKLGDSEAIFVVNADLVGQVSHSALDLLDHTLLALDANTITRIQSSEGGQTLSLQRDKDGWRVESPAAKFQADPQVSDATVNAWAKLEAEKYVAYGPKDLATYGLDKPAGTITVTTETPGADNKAPTKAEHTLELGKAVPGETGARYARLDKKPAVVVLAAPVVAELTRTYLDYVDRTVLKFDAAKVASVQRQMGNDRLELVKRDGAWRILPGDQVADAQAVPALLRQLASLRAVRVAAYQAKDLKPFGLDAPAAVLTLDLGKTDGKDVKQILKIGKVVEETGKPAPAPGEGDRYAVANDSGIVAVLPEGLARRLLAPPLQFRDRGIAKFAEADRILLDRGPRQAAFAKVEGTWKLIVPMGAEAEQSQLEEFVNAFATLRADELVAEKPADLKAYGLDHPEARWRFQAGNKEVLNLLIGAHEKIKGKDGPRCYAKLANGDLVFLLDPGQTSQVLGEYRGRTLWSRLDAPDIDSLHYGYRDHPFTLEKVDNTWHVAGKPDVKVQAKMVSDTLAALGTLQAERYVVDKDADRKLYGLEPPYLALEIQTRSGKRVLHIGNPQGESKRYYARVVDGNRSEVFLISEADAALIVRDLKTFTEPTTKARQE